MWRPICLGRWISAWVWRFCCCMTGYGNRSRNHLSVCRRWGLCFCRRGCLLCLELCRLVHLYLDHLPLWSGVFGFCHLWDLRNRPSVPIVRASWGHFQSHIQLGHRWRCLMSQSYRCSRMSAQNGPISWASYISYAISGRLVFQRSLPSRSALALGHSKPGRRALGPLHRAGQRHQSAC